MIGIGDLHLTDSVGKGGLSAYIDDHDAMVADLVISQVLKYARRHGERSILLYGDVCESPRMSYLAQLALARIVDTPFDLKTGALFDWHVIPGNHDQFTADSSVGHSLEVFGLWKRPNVKLYMEPTDTKIDRLLVRFLPWPHQDFDPKRLNVAHVDVQGSRTDSGRLNDKETMSASKATCVIGHIHTHQKVRNSHYSGTLYQTNFGERPDKFFHHITWDDGWSIESIPVKPTYRLHSVEVESKADLKSIPAGPNDLVKLIIKSSSVQASDYQHLNVVVVKSVKNDVELALARVEDLNQGSQVEISSDEFFATWSENQNRPDPLKKQAAALRRRLLQGVAK